MTKRKSKVVAPACLSPAPITIRERIFNGVIYFLYVFLWFDFSICLSFLPCFIMLVSRIIAWYVFAKHDLAIYDYFTVGEEFTLKNISFFLFAVLPFFAFLIWYGLTTFFLFVGGVYSCCGLRTNFDDSDDVPVGQDYREIEKFLDWRNNKMRFKDYESSAQMMRDSAILNNLDKSDPEARKTLDYINNKMRFKSYPDSLDYLRGKNKETGD